MKDSRACSDGKVGSAGEVNLHPQATQNRFAQRDSAAVQADYMVHDGKTETRTDDAGGMAISAHPIKAIEYPL
jgi:hypothetical protein